MSKIKEYVRHLAVVAMATLAAHCAWAAVPVATWTDFSSVTGTSQVQIDSAEGATYKLTVPSGNTLATDGALVIGSNDGITVNYSGTKVVTVELDVADVPTTDCALITTMIGTSHAICIASNNGTLSQHWTATWSGDYGSATWPTTGRHTVAMTYYGNDSTNAGRGTQTYVDGNSAIAVRNGLISTGTNIAYIRLGAQYANGRPATGMKIYGIRIYDSRLSNSEISEAYMDAGHPFLINLKTNSSADVDGWVNYTHEAGCNFGPLPNNDSAPKFSVSSNNGNFKGSFATASSDSFATGTYVDVKGVSHTTLPEEIAASLGLSEAIPETVYKTGMSQGARCASTQTIAGLVPGKKYVVYAGVGIKRDTTFKSGLKVESSGYTSVDALEYVVTQDGDNTKAATAYTPFEAGTAVVPGQGGMIVIRMVGVTPKSDGSIVFKCDVVGSGADTDGKAALSFVAVASYPKFIYEATINQTTTWADIQWPNTPGWANGNAATITVAADSTLTMGSAIACETLKILGSADLTITDPQNLTYTKLDLSEYTGKLIIDYTTSTNINNNLGNDKTDFVMGNVVGGTIVLKGSSILGLTKINNNLVAMDGTTLKIQGGLVKLGSKDLHDELNNVTISLEGGRLYNYGWGVARGTLTLVGNNENDSVLCKNLGGAPTVVKQGTGKISFNAGTTGGAAPFTSIKAEAGTIAFVGDAVTATTLIAGAGTIEIPNGKTLTVGAVTGEGDVNLAGAGTLKITGAISLTGKINCNGVTIDAATRDLTAFTGPIKLAPSPAEVGAGKVKVTGPAGLVVTVGEVSTTIGEEGTATLVIGEPKVSGNACLFDIVFNHVDAPATIDYKAVSATLQYDSTATFSALEEGVATANTGVYIKHHPYINGADGTFGNLKDFTTVVVGTMSAIANTQFIHFGSTSSKGLFLATTSEKDKILVASNSGTTVKEITTLTVPNSSTARHVYVITKTDSETESIFTVYLDGVKRAIVPMGEKVTIGTTSHSGVQVGSSFGGGLNNGTYKAVADSDNTGVINVLRVFDYIISWDQISKLTTDYPYVAEGGLFQRTIGATADYSAENTWTKAGAETAEFTVPTSQKEGFDPSFEITASEASTLTVNASASIETATTNGGKTTFKKDGENKIAISDSFLVNNQVVVEYGALDISGALVSLRDDDCTLELDMTAYEIPMVMETTLVPLTGQIRETDKMTVTLPSNANHRHLETVYEAGRRQLKITVDTLEVTIPTVSGATSAVTVNGTAVTPTEGKITVPYNAKIVVTYTAETGKHIVGDASVTVESIEEDNIDASSITTAVNVYTVAVTKVENTVVSVKIGDADPVVCTTDTVEVEHGKAFVATYSAADGYKITSGTTEYTYSTVTQNFTEPYATNIVVEEMTALEKLLAAIDAAAEGDTVIATGDIALEAGQIIEKAVVIDLDGNTMTVVAGSTMQSFGATIVNGTVEKSGAMYVGFTADTTATISLLEGGVYVTSGELTVESGVEEKVVATTTSGNLMFYYLADPVTEVTFTITDVQDHVVVTVTADGETLDITADNQFTAPVNTSVVVTSSPAEGYAGTPASLMAFTVVGGMTQTTIAAPQITVTRIVPTATVTDLSKEVATAAGLDAAYAFTAGEAVEGFDDYSATFVVTFDKAIKAGSFELKGAYEADFSTGHASYDWTPMQPAEDINVGDSWVLLPLGTVTYGDVLKIGTFNCGVANKSDDNIGTTMTVKLVITDGTTTHTIATKSYTLEAPKVQPIDPTEPKEYDDATAATAAAAAINADKAKYIAKPFATMTDTQKAVYDALVTAKVVGNAVVIDFSESGETTARDSADNALEATDILDTKKTAATVDAIPGLYYAIVGGTEVDSITTAGTAVQATDTTVTLMKPNLGTTTKAFYQVKVSVTK